MSNTKRLTVYFYKIEPRVTDELFIENQNKLTKHFKFQKTNYEQVEQQDGVVDLYSRGKIDGDLVLGTFTYIQTSDIPPAQNLKTKELTQLKLKNDEGLGFQTSFLFDTKTNILMVVNRRPGVTIGSIKRFVIHNTKACEFDIVTVVTPEKLKEYLGTDRYKKVRVKFARPNNVKPLIASSSPSLNKLINTSQDLESGEMTFEFKSEKKKYLDPNRIRDLVKGFKTEKDLDVKEIKVWGDTAENSNELFDFIANVLKCNITVEKNKKGNFNTKEVYTELKSKFNDVQESLRKLYGNEI